MPAFRQVLPAALLALLGCVDLPASPDEPAPTDPDAAFGAQLAVDGGAWIRPPTGEPYVGPECDPPTSQGTLAGTGGQGDDAPGGAPATAGQGAPHDRDGGSSIGAGAAPRPSLPGDIVVTELMSNPESVRDDAGEWFELYNPHPDRGFDLTGCAIDDGGSAPRTIAGPLPIEAGGLLVIARSAQVEFVPDFTMTFSLANAADVLALLCDGTVIDRVEYGAGFPLAPGASTALDPVAADAAANDAPGVWCSALLAYSADRGTPGAPNPACDDLDAGAE
jgi:hypothetical protein